MPHIKPHLSPFSFCAATSDVCWHCYVYFNSPATVHLLNTAGTPNAKCAWSLHHLLLRPQLSAPLQLYSPALTLPRGLGASGRKRRGGWGEVGGLAPADSEVRNLHLIAVCQPMMWVCKPESLSTPLSLSLSPCLSSAKQILKNTITCASRSSGYHAVTWSHFISSRYTC